MPNRSYSEYLIRFEELVKMGIVKKNKHMGFKEWHCYNFKERVELYLMEEYGTKWFHEICYGHVTAEELLEETLEDIKGQEVQLGILQIIEEFYLTKQNIPNTAFTVFNYLKERNCV